eukprot:1159273-Pelagomonas_calceolata.AAC.3
MHVALQRPRSGWTGAEGAQLWRGSGVGVAQLQKGQAEGGLVNAQVWRCPASLGGGRQPSACLLIARM